MGDPIHDAPLYVQTLAWSVMLTFGFVVACTILQFVGETVEHFTP